MIRQAVRAELHAARTELQPAGATTPPPPAAAPPSQPAAEPTVAAGYQGCLADLAARTLDHLPAVSCVLVVVDPTRLRHAAKAVQQFLAQCHPRKHLVVVNGTGTPLLPAAHPWVSELLLDAPLVGDPARPLGELRNLGLEHAVGDWVMPCWDDDDVRDPYLLAYMAQHLRPGRAALLGRQARVGLADGTAFFVHDPVYGVPNTMLVPKSGHRFDPRLAAGEDVDFLARHHGLGAVVCQNHHFPLSMLSVAVHHGKNVTPAHAFLHGRVGDAHRGRWELSRAEADHLRAVLAPFGLRTEVSSSLGGLRDGSRREEAAAGPKPPAAAGVQLRPDW